MQNLTLNRILGFRGGLKNTCNLRAINYLLRIADELLRRGIITKQHASLDEQLNYRYQIDVDGNGNAWNGCFWKMLTAESVVFKVRGIFH